MIEYTSLEVSRRLYDAGFLRHVRTQPDHGIEYGPCDGVWFEQCAGQDLHGNGKFDFHEFDACGEGAKDQHGGIRAHTYAAYRADTLEMWLLSLDAKEVAEKMGVRTLAENGDRGSLRIEQIRIDFKGTLAYQVQLHRPVEIGAQGPVLVDVLGRLVCGVLGVTV